MSGQAGAGGPGRGATVVCLHGLGRAPSDWDAVRPGLEAFGSVRCPTLSRTRVDALAVASAATGEGAILVGHSMGALLALRLAADPRRSVRALVLTGPSGRSTYSTAAATTCTSTARANGWSR